MTGEGIGQALLTGMLAARALIDHASSAAPIAVTDAYDRAVRRSLVADHRMSTALMVALRRERLTCAAVRVAGATPWTRRNFARWLFEDEPRAALATPRRWHRRFLTRPGAYT
jgi:flavin-dependent dehydrogenase